jgi:hypothetical protein
VPAPAHFQPTFNEETFTVNALLIPEFYLRSRGGQPDGVRSTHTKEDYHGDENKEQEGP